MDDLINQLTAMASTWSQAGALAGLIALVNILVNLTKLPSLQTKIPADARPWIAAGLGMLGGLLTALAAGKPLPAALLSGLVIGMGAIGTHELVSTAKTQLKLRAMRKQAANMGKQAMSLVILVMTLTFASGQLGCKGTSAGTVVTDATDAYDCVQEAATAAAKNINVIQAALDVAAVITAAVADPASLESLLTGLAAKYGPGVLACTVAAVEAQHTPSAGSGSGTKLEAPDPVGQLAAHVIQAKGWKFKAAH